MNVIYMDNNATTKVAPEVVDAMLPFLSEYYGNPSSMHSFGGDVAAKIKKARENVANLIGATSNEIVITSCGTESDGTAIRAAIESSPDKKHIVTTRVEHPAIKSLYETLSKKGYGVTFVPVDSQGRLDLDYLYENLSEDTAIVSVMWANNETGVIFPIEEISQEVKIRGIVFHTDAVQSVGKIRIDVSISAAIMKTAVAWEPKTSPPSLRWAKQLSWPKNTRKKAGMSVSDNCGTNSKPTCWRRSAIRWLTVTANIVC